MRGAESILEELKASYQSFGSGLTELLREHESYLRSFLSEALENSSTAEFGIAILTRLPQEYTQLFFQDLLELASYVNRSTNLARCAIFCCDRTWLLSNLVARIEPLLASEERFLGLFQLANEIHPNCGRNVYELALKSPVQEVREATSHVEKDVAPGG
jgi:hypothetical protein